MKAFKLAAAGTALFISSWTAHAGATFDAVKNKGFVQCGVSTGVAGFSVNDSKGGWIGLDVDLCRAMAIAMFGDASKAKIMAVQRGAALHRAAVRRSRRAAAQHHAVADPATPPWA